MAKVKILIEGYATKKRIPPSTVLIEDSGLKLVDPEANKELLLNTLSKEGLKPEDIDLIFLTHYHFNLARSNN